MKVALLSSLYAPYNVGGTEKAILLLAESLAAHGTEVFVISLHPGREEALEDWNGIRVYRLPIDNIYMPWLGGERPGSLRRLIWHLSDRWNKKAARRVRSILQQEEPDVLHTHSLSGFSVAVCAEARRLHIAHVHTLHDYYLLCTKTTLYRHRKICTKQCLDCAALTVPRKRQSSHMDTVVGITEFILQRHLGAGYFAGVPTQIVPNIQPALPPVTATSSGMLTFGFIGRVTQEKGIETLLQAVAAQPDAPFQLKIAGNADPAYIATLQQRFPDPRIHWLGFIPDTEFFNLVDVVIVPSLWEEPLAYACLETLFVGKSVIASDIGGLREIASLAPHHRLVKPGDVDSLRSAMQQVMEDAPIWRQNQLAPQHVLDRFSTSHVVDQYARVYQAVTSHPGA